MNDEAVKVSDTDLVPPYLRAFVGQEVKGVDEDRRSVTHLITTGSVDRMGDIVDPSGAGLEHYKRNPVVLANHDYRIESVIGRATDMRVTKEGIVSTTVFRDTPLADAAYRLTRERLAGWSIGFRPMESHSVKDGASAGCKSCKSRWSEMSAGKAPGDYIPGGWSRHYTGWEMLEYSSVAVPANQDIVNNAIKLGLVAESVIDNFLSVSTTPTPSYEAAQGPTAKAVVSYPILESALLRTHKWLELARVRSTLDATLERLRDGR